MVSNGADCIDVGGESTRPGSEPVSDDVEKRRVIPVIRSLRESDPTLNISIDTSKTGVAAAAIEAGASMVNDVAGRCRSRHA